MSSPLPKLFHEHPAHEHLILDFAPVPLAVFTDVVRGLGLLLAVEAGREKLGRKLLEARIAPRRRPRARAAEERYLGILDFRPGVDPALPRHHVDLLLEILEPRPGERLSTRAVPLLESEPVGIDDSVI